MKYLRKTKSSTPRINNSSGQIGIIIIFLFLILFSIFVGRSVALESPLLVIGLVGGLIIALITLVNTDLALIILIFSMLLSPEIPIFRVPERAVVVRIDDILLIFMFFTWLAKIAINKQLGLLKFTPLHLPIFLFILSCIVSTVFGISTGNVIALKSFFYLLKYIEYFILYFMVTNNIKSQRQIKIFIAYLMITAVIVCIYAIATVGHFGRATAPFEGENAEPGTLGGYLLFLIALLSSILLYSTSFIVKLLLGVAVCFFIPAFFHTLSRSAFISVIPMYLTLIILTKRKKVLLIILLILIVFFAPFIFPEKVINRAKETFIPGREYKLFETRVSLDLSSSARVWAWQHAFKLWKERPIFGWGVTGIGFIDSQYALFLGELGIVGFFIFVLLLVSIFRNALYIFSISTDNFTKGLTLGFLAGFVGLATQSLGANVFIIVRIMEPFWFLTAIIMMLPEIMPQERSASEELDTT